MLAVGPLGRWAVGPLGRWAVGPLGALCGLSAGLLATTHQARAGEWIVTVEVINGKRVYPVRLPYWHQSVPWDDSEVIGAETYPWGLTPHNGQLPIGEMNLFLGGDTGGSSGDTSDYAGTPQNKSTTTEASGQLKVICKWKAAKLDGETGNWIQDHSKPTEKKLKLTVTGDVSAYSVITVPSDHDDPSEESVTVAVAGLGESADTISLPPEWAVPIERNSGSKTRRISKSQTKQKVFVKNVPAAVGGEYTVEFEIPALSAKGTLTTGNHEAGLTYGSASYNINRIEAVNVRVSSSIDQSWKKFKGSFLDLDDAYKQTNEFGDQASEPNDKAVQIAGADTPTNTSDDVWRIAYLPDSNGKMTVGSSAYYDENLEIWRGNIKVAANPTGYIQPKYEWTQSGGSTSSGTPSPFPGSTWNLSGAIDALRFSDSDTLPVGSSTFTLKVEELEPSLPAIVEEDSYDVNWHMPLEKVAQTTNVSMKAFVKSLTGQIDPGGSAHRYVAKDEDFDIEGVLDGAAVVTGALGQEEITAGLEGTKQTLKVFKAVTSITNLIFHHPGDGPDVTENTTTEFYNNSENWSTAMGDDSQSQNFEPGSEPSEDEKTAPNGYKHYYMIMKEVKHFHHKEWQADRYNSHGFVDDQGVVKANPVDGIDHEPYYIRKPGFPAGQDGGQ